jgi:CheY-like chemotaxis protein
MSGGRLIGWRRSSGEPLEVGQPALDERPDRFLETGLACQLERLLVAPPNLLRRDALLEPVVPGDQEFLNLVTGVKICHNLHSKPSQSSGRFMETAQPLPRDITVLVVDDEPLFIEMIEAMLAAEKGIEVVATARDGRGAVRVAAEVHPDVVIMDVSMPVMDGIDATGRIRKQDPDASVLILTGGQSVDDVDRARQAGAGAYLTKDRIATELVAEIRRLGAR